MGVLDNFFSVPLPENKPAKPVDFYSVGRKTGGITCYVRARDEKHALRIAHDQGLCIGRNYSATHIGVEGYARMCRLEGIGAS